jgi:hypothetical protein
MPLLDWFRGRSARTPTEGDASEPQAERMEARRHEQEPVSAPPVQAESAEGAVDDRRHEEAARHSGI